MAHKSLAFLVSVIVAASPASAHLQAPPGTPAPPGNPNTLYCLRAGPLTGTRLEIIECLTRDEWADGDVDVDREWAENGVRVIG